MPAALRPGRLVEVRAAMSSELSARTCPEDSAASWPEENVLKSVVVRAAIAAVDNDAICAVVSVENVVTGISQLPGGMALHSLLAVQHERDVFVLIIISRAL
jgi:hypothetical protein